MPDRLPIDEHVPAIVDALSRSRALVVTAQPGAGKTTRVPPALVDDGPVILLQPRRVAARAVARRIADECGWRIGEEVGWQIRFDRRFGPSTRLLVVTEGVLTARLQQDPLLSGFRTIVIDEFHERSIHADVAIALARQAWLARDDLRIVVMSATLDTEPVSKYLGRCPVVEVPGRLHPIDVAYRPGIGVADAVGELWQHAGGDVLCFLPGAAEINRTIGELKARPAGNAIVVPLHGSLDAEEQDAALRPSRARRIVVATNIAETSLTVPGVTAVVDSGLHKVARYDAERGIDSLELERITADSAEQRAGRAGRIAPGLVRRLWDQRDRLRPHREPEIERVDLASAALDIFAWRGDPAAFEWFEQPPEHAIAAAVALLERLGAVRAGRLTVVGDALRAVPVHPRLARMLIAARGARSAARVCALLSERHLQFARGASCTSDLLAALDVWDSMPPHVRAVADELERVAARELGTTARTIDDPGFRRAVLSGYPDRVARRREAGSSRLHLASGAGGTLAADSGVRDAEFLVALDVQASPDRPDARVRLASAVDREWLTPTRTAIEHRYDASARRVRAQAIDYYDAIVLSERPADVDPEIAAHLLADEWLARGMTADDRQLVRRLAFAGRGADVAALARTAAYGARSLDDVALARALDPEVARALDREAPQAIVAPSGRTVRLEYDEHGGVTASVKLQELFGLAETPRIGKRREAVLLALLAPNGRPVQMTRDLRSFWERTYPEIRKELRGRYPKHPWPDDPWSAKPTARAKPRRSRP